MIKLFVATLLASLLLLVTPQTVIVNSGCKTYSKDGSNCILCSDRYYMDGSGICQKVSADCKTYNGDSGACLTCYDGYFLADVICVFGTSPDSTIDPYCVKIVNQVCNKCAKGFYLSGNTCTVIDPLCKSFDQSKLVCTDCYPGFLLDSGANCVVKEDAPSAIGCSQVKNSVCVKCSKGYYFDSDNNICVQINPNCKTSDNVNGQCLSCYSGFKLFSGACLVDNQTAYNPYCQKFQNSNCVSCSKGYYFDINKICQQVDPLCKFFDYSNTICTTCFYGFTLVNGSCLISDGGSSAAGYGVSDPNCRKFDANGKCLNCSNGFYFNQEKVCTQIDPSCKKFDQVNLVCVLCYAGFDLVNGQCILGQNSVSTCAQWWNNVCVKCASRCYFDFDGNCAQVSDSCNTFNTFSGKCTSCYSGFSLDNKGGCNPSDSPNSCAQVDKKIGVCIKCFNGSYLNAASECLPIDPLCSAFNYQTYQCTSCYKGYSVTKDGECKEQVNVVTSSIQNCVEYDANQNCAKCYNLYYLSNNACIGVNPLCKTYDSSNGSCLSCYSFFALKDGVCSLK